MRSNLTAPVVALGAMALVLTGCGGKDDNPKGADAPAKSATTSPTKAVSGPPDAKKDHPPEQIGNGDPLSDGDRDAIKLASGTFSGLTCKNVSGKWTASGKLNNTKKKALAITLTFRVRANDGNKAVAEESQTVELKPGESKGLTFSKLGDADAKKNHCNAAVSAVPAA